LWGMRGLCFRADVKGQRAKGIGHGAEGKSWEAWQVKTKRAEA